MIILITSCYPFTALAYTPLLSYTKDQPTLAAKGRSLYDLSNIMS